MDTLLPDEYWPKLREIPEPPERLWVRGTIPGPERKLITIVGSRSMSQYAHDAVDYLVSGLADYPVAIVSGLALGVDGAAHRAAMKHGLPTVAFPGSGLNDDALYPATHKWLAQEILATGGALVSEFPPEEKGRVHFFPKRNRIMVGVSDAVVVVEAGLKSGTLITARMAVDYNRDLLVVPHSIFSDGGAGGHVFMKLGALPARSASDVLEAIGIVEDKNIETLRLTSEEEEVLALLMEPIPRDELIRELGIPTGQANVLLAQMEIRGLIGESLGSVRKLI
ncbi:MAG: DNA-processing protein DprA [Candidatus Pacebacteria bacterium]|nr:DNA-processing protein DprA [Candidatus Paceibacterota bacterium]